MTLSRRKWGGGRDAPPEPGADRLSPEVRRIALVVLTGSFMSILDTTIVNVALDRLARTFGSGFDHIQWVVTGYMLALAAVIPLSGWVATRFGPRRVFVTSAILFTAGSALCGLAWSLPSLVGFRVVQGLGGGLLMPVGQMMLAQAAGPRRMGRVMSVLAVPLLIAPILGPVLGGLIVDNAGWEWIFYVNVPVGAAAVAFALRLLPRDRPGRSWRFDPLGIALMAVGVPSVTYGLAEVGSSGGISAMSAWLPLLVGLVLTSGYVLYAVRVERPLINVRLFGNGGFAAASITAFALGAALFGGMILLPLYEQVARGQSALATGLYLVPQGLGAAAAASISGRLVDRIGGGIVALVGLSVLILSTLPFTTLSATTPQAAIMVGLFVRGAGIGGSMMPAFAAAYASLHERQVPDATSQLNVLQRVGGSIGSAVLAVLLQRQLGGGGTEAALHGSLPPAAREHAAEAFATTHWGVVGFSVLAMIPAVGLLRVERRARAAEIDGREGREAPSEPGRAPTPAGPVDRRAAP